MQSLFGRFLQEPQSKEEGQKLVNDECSFVEQLQVPEYMVNAERYAPENTPEHQAPTAPVIELKVQVPEDLEQGQSVCTQGPHGPIKVPPPANIKGGESFQCRLAPPPELKITVPQGFKGSSLIFETDDGNRISVPVPKGKGPGDVLYVTPP